MAERSRTAGATGGLARISGQQLVAMTYVLHFTAAVLVLPATLAKYGHSGGWLGPLPAYVVSALPVSLMVGLLVRRYPQQGLSDLSRHLLGPLLGRLIGLLVGVFNLLITALTLRDVVEITPVAILPATPAWALSLPFMLVAVYGAYSGVEVLARLSYLFAVTSLLFIVAAISTLTGLIHPLRLLPLYERGPLQLLQASWPSIGWYAESWSFLALAAQVDRRSQAARALLMGAGFAALMLMMFTALAITVFGHQLVAQFTFPIYSLIQQVSIGEFVERLDVLMFAIWLVGMVVKASMHLWLAANGAGFALGVKNERTLLPGLGLASYIVMSLIPSLSWLFVLSTKLWTPVSLGLGLGIPGLLLAASWVKQRRQRTGIGPGSQRTP